MLLDDDKFLSEVYKIILGREIDPEGKIFYSKKLRNGVDRIKIIGQIYYSKEAKKKGVSIPWVDYNLKFLAVTNNRFFLYFFSKFIGVNTQQFKNYFLMSNIIPVNINIHEKNSQSSALTSPNMNENNSITISVIIPFYNGSEYIERAIISARNQTYQACEIIVIDDGSHEKESDICKSICKKHQCLYEYKTNGGQGDARNYGVKMAVGDYICLLDQDDFFMPNHNEILVSAVDTSPSFGFSYANLSQADLNGKIIRSTLLNSDITGTQVHPKKTIIDCLSQDMFILPSASIISKKAFLAVGGFDSRLTGYEDDDLFLRLFREGYDHHFIDKPVTVWCIHDGSTSYSIRMARSRLIYFSKLISIFSEKNSQSPGNNFIRDIIIPRFINYFVVDAIKFAVLSDKNSKEYASILESAIANSKEWMDAEMLAHLNTILHLITLERKHLVNTLYFGKISEKFGFIQTFNLK